MVRRVSVLLLLGALLLPPPALADEAPRLRFRTRVLAEDTRYQTEALQIDTGRPGPRVLVVGGIHGDEPAGWRAARQISGWSPTRGTLLVVPRANEPGLARGRRTMPDLPRAQRDLNRQFPLDAAKPPVGTMAQAVWDLVEDFKPTHVLDLHEGHDVHRRNPKSVGATVISPTDADALGQAQAMVDAVNAEISDASVHYMVIKNAVPGSLVRACVTRRKIPAFILETTRKGLSIAYRTRQHRLMVHAFLTGLDMLEHGPHLRFGTRAGPKDIRVGLYISTGSGGPGPRALERLVDAAKGMHIRRLGSTDVRLGDLDECTVLCFPGGSASAQAKAIRAEGREHVRSRVRDGTGYLGICAGAYLAAANYDWSLKILDANVIDRAHWARGRGMVPLEVPLFSALRRTVEGRETPVLYANGPIYEAADHEDIPDFRVLATYAGEVVKEGVPGGVMPDTPALVHGRFGQGHVVCSSPHPEQTKGLEPLTLRLIELAAGRR